MRSRSWSTRALVLALVGGLVGALVVVAAWRAVTGSLTPEKTAEVCNVDTTASGFQGWCVQRRHRTAGPFTDEVSEVWIVARQDGADLPRHSYLPLPSTAADGRFDVIFGTDAIVVTLDENVVLTIPAEYYRLA